MRELFESLSPEQTELVAAELAAELAPGDVVTVSGELGAGKTTFIRGACRALGVQGPVTSPTYTVGHAYHGRVEVSHLDLYRFDTVSEAEWGDLEGYFENAIVFVEWPEAGFCRIRGRPSVCGPRGRRIDSLFSRAQKKPWKTAF